MTELQQLKILGNSAHSNYRMTKWFIGSCVMMSTLIFFFYQNLAILTKDRLVLQVICILFGAVAFLTLLKHRDTARIEFHQRHPVEFNRLVKGPKSAKLRLVHIGISAVLAIMLLSQILLPILGVIDVLLSLAILSQYLLLIYFLRHDIIGISQLAFGLFGLIIFLYWMILAFSNSSSVLTNYILFVGLFEGYAIVRLFCLPYTKFRKIHHPRENYFNFRDAYVIKKMLTSRNWKEEIPGFHLDVVWDLLDRFQDFENNNGVFQNPWTKQFVRALNRDASAMEFERFIDEMFSQGKKGRFRTILLLLVTGIFPPIIIWFLPWHSKPVELLNGPSIEYIEEVENMIEDSRRRCELSLTSSGEIIGIKYRKSGSPTFEMEEGETFLFSTPEVFYDDVIDFRFISDRDEQLEKNGLIYPDKSYVAEIIRITGLSNLYMNRCKVVQIKVLGNLHQDFNEAYKIDSSFQVSIFPQFQPEIVLEDRQIDFNTWLNTTKLSRNDKLSSTFLSMLKFPELHLHIGGVLSLEDQIRVGIVIWNVLTEDEKINAKSEVGDLIKQIKTSTSDASGLPNDWHIGLSKLKSNPRRRGAAAAAILTSFESDIDCLHKAIFPSRSNRWEQRIMLTGDRFTGKNGYAGYSTPGELMGSTLLAFPDDEVIREYAKGIINSCVSQRIRYVEIRMSPTKYRKSIKEQVEFVKEFVFSMNYLLSLMKIQIEYRVLISADRSVFNDSRKSTVFFNDFKTLMQLLRQDTTTRSVVVGYDIAGREIDDDIPGEICKKLTDLNLELDLNSTFHAGEQADSSNLRSAYQIHTNRVGHALKLVDNLNLMKRFQQVGICIEMCPTSNIEVHGFRTPNNDLYPSGGTYPKYPLREYINSGLLITVCTDNPFISRTTMENEYFTASDLCLDQPLSFMEVLKILYNGYKCAFLEPEIKTAIINQTGKEVYTSVYGLFESRKER
jgi:adenosine deaminase